MKKVKTIKYLYELEKHTKIYCECSDNSSFILFDHIDGMYSYCVTENGNVVHLGASAKIDCTDKNKYKICSTIN